MAAKLLEAIAFMSSTLSRCPSFKRAGFAFASRADSSLVGKAVGENRLESLIRLRHLLLPILAAMTLLLQGCGAVPTHKVANWMAKPDYLGTYSFVPPSPLRIPGHGKERERFYQGPVLNSCNVPNIPASQRCSGRGYCEAFTTNALVASRIKGGPAAFCRCEEEWADPECGTKRKSQMTAFFYSLFLGYFGADYFYLGFPGWGVVKLCTLGGCGFWWITDIIRTASGPVYAIKFRTASDLPHWVAMLILLSIGMLIGFLVGLEMYLSYRTKKRADMALLQNVEKEQKFWSMRKNLGLHYGSTAI